MELLIHWFFLSIATGACALTVSKMAIFQPLREWVAREDLEGVRQLLRNRSTGVTAEPPPPSPFQQKFNRPAGG